MTQKEIDKFLANTKVYVNGKSKEIQEKLFSLGYSWGDGSRIVDYLDKPFLFIHNRKTISYSDDMRCFTEQNQIEISSDEILSIELEQTYRPFNNKEECWQEMLKHEPFGWLQHIYNHGYEPFMKAVNRYTEFEKIMKEYTFADGAPFGIKEE